MLNIILESVNIGEITELNHANGTVKSGIFKTPTKKTLAPTNTSATTRTLTLNEI